MRKALFLCFLMLASSLLVIVDNAESASGRSGIDVYISDYSFDYVNSADVNTYKMFSSNYPVSGFNKPETLFITDGVLGADLRISFTISNDGTSDSSGFAANVVILHDEYIKFELLNTTVQVSNVPAQGTSTVSFDWIPNYAGNHSLVINLANTNDDNYANNERTRHLTIAWLYDNCDDLSQWSAGTGWQASSDATISMNSACHVGNGESSTYGDGWSTSLDTPVWDLSDIATNPTRVIGYGFFYTGSILSGDSISLQARKNDGSWEELGSLTGTIDASFQDGSTNWQTFSNTVGSQTTPVIPMQPRHFHTSSQLRFYFSSDSSGSAIGYWIDDIVLIYDQKAKVEEFDWDIATVGSAAAQREEWSDQTIAIQNNGNLSDKFIPSVSGLPDEWEVIYTHESGSNIDALNGVRVAPGESKDLHVKIRPGPNASLGVESYVLDIRSMEQSSVFDSRNVSITVLADFIPSIQPQISTPVCAAGNSCEFFVTVENIGDSSDTFDLEVSPFDVKTGWSLGLAWDQSTSIVVAPGTPELVKMMVSVPEGEAPDVSSSVNFQATSRTDPERSDSIQISAAAAMVSAAEFSLEDENIPTNGWEVEPGESIVIRFSLWNNASRQDTFSFSLDVQGGRTWSVDVQDYPNLPINSGSSATYIATITAPTTAQAGDPGPVLTPQANSIRSNMNASTFQFSELRVSTLHDLLLRASDMPPYITPGIGTGFNIEIENDGNGPVDAILSLPDLPPTWQWWSVVDGVNITGPIRLSPSYEQMDIAYVELFILAPADEIAGESLEFSIVVEPWEGEDIDLTNNEIIHEVITSQVRQPILYPPEESEYRMNTDGAITIYFNVLNLGNTRESEMKVRVDHTSTPAAADITTLLERGSKSSASGQWLTSSVLAGQQVEYMLTIIADSDLTLNTKLNLKITVVGGLDEFSQPLMLEHEFSILADVRRDITANLLAPTDGESLKSGEEHTFTVELESHSSIPEIITLNFTSTRTLICNGNPINSGSYSLTLQPPPSHTSTFDKVICKATQGDSDEGGEIQITVSVENNEITSWTISSDWQQKQVASNGLLGGVGETEYIAGGAGILLLVVITLLVLSRKGSKEEEEYEDEENYQGEEDNYSAKVLAPIEQNYQAYPTAAVVETIPSGPPITQIIPVVQEPVVQEPKQWSREELLASGWTNEQIVASYPHLAVSSTSSLINAFDSLGGNSAPQEQEQADGPALPAVNCVITGQELTSNDQWAQCTSCGAWAEATAKVGCEYCPRCRAAW